MNNDPVTVTAAATVAGVSRTVSVQIAATGEPLAVLRYALTAGNTVKIENKACVYGNVHTHANIVKTGGDTWIIGDAEAVTTIDETTNITGAILPGSLPKSLPSTDEILAYYLPRATEIPYRTDIDGVVISAASNPYGPTNPNGIYYIDMADNNLTIKHSMIQATLILLNAKDSKLDKMIQWWAPAPNQPALIVTTSALFRIQMDLNAFVDGMIYVDGNLELSQRGDTYGPVIATGTINIKDEAYTYADNDVYNDPPPPFEQGGETAIVENSWRSEIPAPAF